MSSYTDVKKLIISNIKANGQREITGPILQDVLLNMLENSSEVEEITYDDLKALRDQGKLTPSRLYRIIDYVTTTTQSGTKSAGHPFDIIVLTLSESELSEQAWAIKSERDTDGYFANSELSAWKIWYCLDNDTNRFAWADTENGKGVIYRMIDEFNNDVPYDFKNIQFYRKWDSSKSLWSIISDNIGVPCYTFSSKGNSSTTSFTDMSLSASNSVYSNVIKEHISSSSNKQILNNICFFGNNNYSNTFRNNCSENTFGNDCYANTFGNKCYSNTFGNKCYFNTFGDDCQQNTFGNDFRENTFGNKCSRNTFGTYCYSNTFGNGCWYNTFKENCWYNAFGNYCQYNTFGNNCWNNTFGNYCTSNIFGNYCTSNIFGNECDSNTFRNDCGRNSFGNNCNNIKFASDNPLSTDTYYQNNHFGDGCKYIFFTGTETASSSQQVQNYNFAQGLQGDSNSYLTIDGVRNRAFETKVAKNSDGGLKIYCEADLIK